MCRVDAEGICQECGGLTHPAGLGWQCVKCEWFQSGDEYQEELKEWMENKEKE